jgi:hypothetical protein
MRSVTHQAPSNNMHVQATPTADNSSQHTARQPPHSRPTASQSRPSRLTFASCAKRRVTSPYGFQRHMRALATTSCTSSTVPLQAGNRDGEDKANKVGQQTWQS